VPITAILSIAVL